jgi:Putative bacterial sensory transduction regulator
VSSLHLEGHVQRVGAMLEELFPNAVERIPSVPAFEVRIALHDGSARTFVHLVPFDGDQFLVRTNAWVLSNVEPSGDLCRELLRRNALADLGAYYLSEDRHVGFAHSIVGSSLDPGELKASVLSVAGIADRDDDTLQRWFGGHRAADIPPTE